MDVDQEEKHSIAETIIGGISALNLKLLFFLFLLFLLVTSNAFVDNILVKFQGAVENKSPTFRGVAIQGIFLILFYIILDKIIEWGLI
ncbi:MAG: hypothetical protein QW303_02070 [Nitrososphaerota archaeon]